MKKIQRSKRSRYMKKQKRIGILIVLCSILIGLLMPAFGLFGIIVGLVITYTKDSVWMDDYFWDQQSKKEEL